MKTKDFIKMLQEEDPTGEGYVRVNGGAITFCEAKEGYWDGAYTYFDRDTRTWHSSTQGYKIDVHTITWEDVVWELNGDMEKIKEKLKPDYSGYVNGKEYEENFWKKVEEEAVSAKQTYDKLTQEMFERTTKKFNDGYTFWTLNNDKAMIFNGARWKKFLKKESAVYGEMRIIENNPELFEKKIKGKFVCYKLKNN